MEAKIMVEKLINQGKESRAHFEIITKKPMEVNLELLKGILCDNKNTEYGKKYGFGNIGNFEEFAKKVPLSNYSAYSEAIERMKNGENNLIMASKADAFAQSLGKDGSIESIPLSADSFRVYNKYGACFGYSIFADTLKDKWTKDKAFSLAQSKFAKTKCGIPIGAFSGLMAGGLTAVDENLKAMVAPQNTTPLESVLYSEPFEDLYVHARFALANKDISGIRAVLITEVSEFIDYLEGNWEMLVEDIKAGTINQRVNLPQDIREYLTDLIEPMPSRAEELQSEFEKGFDSILERVWPFAAFVFLVGGGDFASYVNKLRKYIGGIPIHFGGYLVAGGIVAVCTEVGNPYYALLPDTVFYEFIPADLLSEPNPKTLTLDKVEIGKDYQMVITNRSGFYRFRTKDVVRVVDRFNDTPQVQFSLSLK